VLKASRANASDCSRWIAWAAGRSCAGRRRSGRAGDQGWPCCRRPDQEGVPGTAKPAIVGNGFLPAHSAKVVLRSPALQYAPACERWAPWPRCGVSWRVGLEPLHGGDPAALVRRLVRHHRDGGDCLLVR
jgi:hypothetical protein